MLHDGDCVHNTCVELIWVLKLTKGMQSLTKVLVKMSLVLELANNAAKSFSIYFHFTYPLLSFFSQMATGLETLYCSPSQAKN